MPYFRLPKFHAVSILTNATCTFQIRGMRLIRARQNPRYVTSTAEYRAPMSLTIILKGQSRKVWAVERFRVQHCFSIFPFPKIFCKYCFIISQVGFIEKDIEKQELLKNGRTRFSIVSRPAVRGSTLPFTSLEELLKFEWLCAGNILFGLKLCWKCPNNDGPATACMSWLYATTSATQYPCTQQPNDHTGESYTRFSGVNFVSKG